MCFESLEPGSAIRLLPCQPEELQIVGSVDTLQGEVGLMAVLL